MACLRCRHRKVKVRAMLFTVACICMFARQCKPTQDHPERRCERCIKANLDCTYIPVAAQEIQASLRDQVVVEGNFNFRKVDVPDGTIQVFLGDQGLPFEALPSIPTYQQTPFNAWPTVYDIAPRAERDNTVYGAASPYGHNFQQGVYGTHDGRHPASDSHAVDSWLGQVYDKSHHYQPRESFPPSASTGSSSAAGANSTSNYNLYVAPIEMRCDYFLMQLSFTHSA